MSGEVLINSVALMSTVCIPTAMVTQTHPSERMRIIIITDSILRKGISSLTIDDSGDVVIDIDYEFSAPKCDLVTSYSSHLEQRHDTLLEALFDDGNYKKLYSYKHLIKGFAVDASPKQFSRRRLLWLLNLCVRNGSDESEFNDKRRWYQCISVVPIPYVSADIASHGPSTGASISVSSSMTGKTKLDGTIVHISDLPRIPQRRYKHALAVADNGSVRTDEMPRSSTDLDDDNLCLSLNADIPTHADNDLPRPYATGDTSLSLFTARCTSLGISSLIISFVFANVIQAQPCCNVQEFLKSFP
ncbi:subtilisin-like protease SBT2.6 isoform X1 [Tanacetum coccineum]